VARGPSAQELLEIDWKYPVFKAEAKLADDGRTVAGTVQRALPLERAVAYLAGEDPRPLLVLRECLVCNGTDKALLGAEADNEKTVLLTRWFHCVKLPVDVMLKEDHPFHDTGPFPLAFFFSAVEEVTAVDPLTVEFRLNAPYAPFLSNLAYPTGLIVSPAAVEQNGAEFGRNPSGTGPFRFVEWRSNEAVGNYNGELSIGRAGAAG
jgi:hypothetical protein